MHNQHVDVVQRPARPKTFSRVLRGWLGASIALGLALLMGLGIKSWREERQDMLTGLAVQAGMAARSSQAEFDKLGASMELLGRILKDHGVPDDLEAARGLLLEFQASHPGTEAVALISPAGRMLVNTATSIDKPLPDFRMDPAYLRSFLFDLNNTYSYSIGLNQYGKGLDKWHFPFRHVVVDENDKPLFVIQGAIPVDRGALLWSGLPLPAGSRVGLMRYDGQLQLAWPAPDPERAYRQPQSGGLAHILRTQPGFVTGNYAGFSGIDGLSRIGAYARLPEATMVAFASVPESMILKRWWQHNYVLLMSFVAYIVMISAVSLMLGRREKRHTEELITQSRHDSLTGLHNRLAISELISGEMARAQRNGTHSALLYLDLDRFKDINDGFGHLAGDKLLVEVAARLRTVLRAEDRLARLGGDEFLVLVADGSVDDATMVAERILATIAAPLLVDEEALRITASIGICVLPDDGADVDTLLQHADAAMYEAKHHGRNCYAFYQESLGQRILQRLRLREDFKRAIAKQEFVLHYQPLVDMCTGDVIGAEALVRWDDPERGLRGPGDFIPCAEESGLILPLGEWILREACRQCKEWEAAGHDLHVAVNLSMRQFQDPDLVAKIRAVLDEAQLSPTKLELEITESAAMQDAEASIAVMNSLKMIGIRLAIDDFGTGYSSLSYLKRIPADIIKIDRSFVSEIHNNPDDFAIVRTVLALGASLEKRCLAEGIETAEHYEVLRDLGCHYAQGYWISRPLAVHQFHSLLARDAMASQRHSQLV